MIREKVDLLFEDTLSDLDREEICTLIYYPVEKLAMIKKEGKRKMIHNKMKQGIKDGVPIAIGYFSVSFTFGMLAAKSGISIFHAVLISLLNLTSAGQFAGMNAILAQASFMEMALTQLVINIRYSLMSLSLSQKLDSSVKVRERLAVSYGVTDEIFAVASSKPGTIGAHYMYGLILLPVLGWVGGTFAGAAAGSLLPAEIISALGVALYGMFIAIVVPVAAEHKEVKVVVLTALCLSTALYYLPIGKRISSGFSMIICTVFAAGLGAVLFPIKEEQE